MFWTRVCGTLLTLALLACGESVPAALFQRWTHSYEEDTETVKVYRPRGYPFPLSRGRNTIEFFPDGRFLQYAPGAADRPVELKGRWESAGSKRIRVVTPGDGKVTRVFDIQKVSQSELRLRPLDR